MRLFFNQPLASQALCVCCQYQKQQKMGFCLGCYHDLPHLRHPCLRCGLALTQDNVCSCRPEDWPFSACISAFDYQFPINKLILHYKNQARLTLCQGFAQALALQIQQQKQALPQLLVPVPLSPHKLTTRGFNQSAELAKDLGKLLSIPVDCHILCTTGQEISQKQLNKQQRLRQNTAQYALNKPLPYQHIAIIDDVITTGATTKALAYLLRESGVKTIQSWAVARTL